ncbi:MAG: hypothetical protein ACYCQK_06970 [Acidiferrobacteraceae bacterium]
MHNKWVAQRTSWRLAFLGGACLIAAALGITTPALARDRGATKSGSPQSLSADRSLSGPLFRLSGVRIDDRGLGRVYGRGLGVAPHAHGQVAVILWDERGNTKTGGGDVFAAQSSTGSGNVQMNRLTQN